MIKQITPYLYFEGNAEEALNFYKEVLGGENLEVMRYENSQEISEKYKNKIMHARLEFKTFNLYFSDTHDAQKTTKGDNISLTLEFDTEEAIDKTYADLSDGGNVYMELQKTFWNAKYAKITDKFGVSWDLNYQF